MRRYFVGIAAILTAMLCFSCSGEDVHEFSDERDDTADYTVIFWGTAGGEDRAMLTDFERVVGAFQGGVIRPNVNFTGLVQTTLSQSEPLFGSFDATYYFASADELFEDETADTTNIRSKYANALRLLNGQLFAGPEFDLSNPLNLAIAIKEAARKYPANHFVLAVRGTQMTPADIVTAVNNSGTQVRTLFACSESLAQGYDPETYRLSFDYALLSASTSASSNLPWLLAFLTDAAGNPVKQEEYFRSLAGYDAQQHPDRDPADASALNFVDLRTNPAPAGSAE